MTTAVIVSATRTPVGRAHKGALKDTRPDTLGAAVIKEAVARAKGLDPALIDDVIFGCAMPEGEQGLNVARILALSAGLPNTSSAMTINRFCSSGLQAVAQACERVIAGQADCIVAGGVESMTYVPMSGFHFSANYDIVQDNPQIYIPMGATAENVASQFGVSRKDQDEFAYNSQQKAAAAVAANRFGDEFTVINTRRFNEVTNEWEAISFNQEEMPRADTSVEGLGKLRPAFNPKGSVTAGNSSPLSDGASALVVMSEEKAKEIGAPILAKYVSFQVAGVDPAVMGIGPVKAIPKALKRAGLELKDIDIIELNEAFASQSLYCIRELGLDTSKVNVNGGAIALGHPLGATGAKLTTQAIYETRRRGGKYAMVSMCIGGGMGAAGIFEVVS
jgi:acetyl-CoA acyltransferase